MGYLNNSTILVDAILTKRGRELLARGQNEFNITHFALADDEIDYTLWNSDHPLGSAYYGKVIEDMPVVEAVTDDTQMMKYKLVTLPKKTIRIPVVAVPNNSITLNTGQSDVIQPSTVNYTEGNSTYGYTAVLSDSDACTLQVEEASSATFAWSAPLADMDSGQSVTLVGKSFRVTAKSAIAAPKTTTLTIYGNETGGSTVLTITVNQQTLTNTGTITS